MNKQKHRDVRGLNKRLVWNFEINNDKPLILPDSPAETHTEHWEARFFWPESESISLNGLDDSFLELSRYKIKHREDTYCLLPDMDCNFKVRRDQLQYKPIIMKLPLAIAYGKKITLEQADTDMQRLFARAQREGHPIVVEKEALIYQFETLPKTKLELARLCVANTTWFSVNIESASGLIVDSITRQMLGEHVACDYVTFLKRLL